MTAAPRPDGGKILDCSGHVGDMTQDRQRRRGIAASPAKILWGNKTTTISGDIDDLDTPLLQSPQRPRHGIMLHIRRDHPITGTQETKERLIDRRRGVGGKDHPARIVDPEETGHCLAGRKDNATGIEGELMPAPTRITAELTQGLVDAAIDRLRLGKRGSGIIEIDGHTLNHIPFAKRNGGRSREDHDRR